MRYCRAYNLHRHTYVCVCPQVCVCVSFHKIFLIFYLFTFFLPNYCLSTIWTMFVLFFGVYTTATVCSSVQEMTLHEYQKIYTVYYTEKHINRSLYILFLLSRGVFIWHQNEGLVALCVKVADADLHKKVCIAHGVVEGKELLFDLVFRWGDWY